MAGAVRRLEGSAAYEEDIRPWLGRIAYRRERFRLTFACAAPRFRAGGWRSRPHPDDAADFFRIVLKRPVLLADEEFLALALAHEARHVAAGAAVVARGGWPAYIRHRVEHRVEEERECLRFELAIGEELGVRADLLEARRWWADMLPPADVPRLQRDRLRLARRRLLKRVPDASYRLPPSSSPAPETTS